MEKDNKMVKALILRSAGINCNDETEKGFRMAGAETEQIHVNKLISGEKKLTDYDILALPGGFSYGDYIAGGSILANQLSVKLRKQMEEFIEQGKVVVGICNGFQVLVKTGFLPGDGMKATLTNNDSGKFECRWVKLKGSSEMDVPVAHGEGKFFADNETLDELEENGQVMFRYSSSEYPENPNGSLRDIAGITNTRGNVIGLMPHPERHLTYDNHPKEISKESNEGEGLKFFKNIIERCKTK
ncbi:phosphoribosylformylglycinamidine synthase I [Candidatus Woesearchaeota archaeon]|nr:phosphoribosylformylglycinamidine synthase I [Candidatus Woesearchaeota archaeon]|tara:strand:+ start:26194 stop:26922 length:729 start_codon:yes stop_codon:yes gene_type:complete